MHNYISFSSDVIVIQCTNIYLAHIYNRCVLYTTESQNIQPMRPVRVPTKITLYNRCVMYTSKLTHTDITSRSDAILLERTETRLPTKDCNIQPIRHLYIISTSGKQRASPKGSCRGLLFLKKVIAIAEIIPKKCGRSG